MKIDYDNFLTKIYNYSPYFGKERYQKDYATPFYLRALSNTRGRILELGTCTGLLTIPLVKAGYMVDSVDISPEMHTHVSELIQNNCSKNKDKIRLFTCNAFDFEPDTEYSSIVMPDSFLAAQADIQEQKKLLRKCNELLPIGGFLVFDIFKPWDDMIAKGKGEQCSRFRLPTGELYIVYTEHVIDLVHQLHTFHFRHVSYKEEKTYTHSITYRYMWEKELKEMLDECGFNIIEIDADFNHGANYSVIASKKMVTDLTV